ncbi:MAG: DUF927 domain-containing protein [Lachnospiraceae bacterium]|nr:DUF927 domain-containing protein [Lachnospiraceae bacterium]
MKKIIKIDNEINVKEGGVIFSKEPEGLVSVVGYSQVIETGEYLVDIDYLDVIGREHKKLRLTRTELFNKKKFCSLIHSKGGVCSNVSYDLMIEKMNENLRIPYSGANFDTKDLDGEPVVVQKVVRNIRKIHSTTGFFENENGLQFRGKNIQEEGREPYSNYVGKLGIGICGNYEVYREMLEHEVLGNIPLESVMAMAASATVLSYANVKWSRKIYNPIFHVYGNSSSGKTTAVQLAVSLGGMPMLSNDQSLFMTFHSTSDAIMKKIGNNNGFPIAIDEISMLGNKDITALIYALAEGIEKERLVRAGNKLQDKSEFSTTVFTNGESSIFSRCRQNDGLRYRVFEFDNITWTQSAENANKIKAVVSENYGHVIPMVATELLENGDYWEKVFENWVTKASTDERIDKKCKVKIERIAPILGLCMVSAEILTKVLKMKFNIIDIYNFLFKYLIQHVCEMANIGARAYRALFDFYVNNKDSFSVSSCRDPFRYIGKGDYGMVFEISKPKFINDVKYDRCLIFTQERFRTLVEGFGFEDVDVVLHQLKDDGLLMTKDKSRAYAKMIINDEECKVNRVLIPEANYDLNIDDDE